MAVSAEFRDHVADLFARFGEIEFKLMFGGAGIYHKDQIFGLIMDERIYLKTDAETRQGFEAEGFKPFFFENSSGEVVSTGYLEIPSRLLDDPDGLAKWARRAYDVAIAARGRKRRPAAKRKLPRDLPILSPKKK